MPVLTNITPPPHTPHEHDMTMAAWTQFFKNTCFRVKQSLDCKSHSFTTFPAMSWVPETFCCSLIGLCTVTASVSTWCGGGNTMPESFLHCVQQDKEGGLIGILKNMISDCFSYKTQFYIFLFFYCAVKVWVLQKWLTSHPGHKHCISFNAQIVLEKSL